MGAISDRKSLFRLTGVTLHGPRSGHGQQERTLCAIAATPKARE